jgi:hypothetical protein
MNDEILLKAMAWAKENKPEASIAHKAAFANSVQYLVTGWSGGFGGVSLREHLVSWSLAGVNGRTETVSIGGEAMTAIYPDGSLPMAGEWSFEDAVKFAEPLCFGSVNDYRNTLLQIQEREHCFDDDPQDLADLRGKSV